MSYFAIEFSRIASGRRGRRPLHGAIDLCPLYNITNMLIYSNKGKNRR